MTREQITLAAEKSVARWITYEASIGNYLERHLQINDIRLTKEWLNHVFEYFQEDEFTKQACDALVGLTARDAIEQSMMITISPFFEIDKEKTIQHFELILSIIKDVFVSVYSDETFYVLNAMFT